MTEEEHIARAMLLGMKYHVKGSYYVDEETPGIITEAKRLDADTLEPIGFREAMQRLAKK